MNIVPFFSSAGRLFFHQTRQNYRIHREKRGRQNNDH